MMKRLQSKPRRSFEFEMPNLIGSQEARGLSGAGLLGLVTTGMYDDPLSMYREYIQNAADAVSKSEMPGRARVDISIDNVGRWIRIRDYGPGLSREEALKRLIPIGQSDKTLGADRGFRGVGRLAGLAFAKKVSFTTRSREDQTVTRITWHSDRLPELTSMELDLEQAILDCVDEHTVLDSDYPEHFFEVELREVARHSAGLLLSRDLVREYIGEVCPVPLRAEFPFAERVEELFCGVNAPLTLEVKLQGELDQVVRPYGESIRFSADKEADFKEFEAVHIRNVDDSGAAAIGWIAHSPYLGAIPKEQRVRGIRARMGNIQIGGETVFDDLFAEERFNRWCVGELHILDSRIVPNARRDYFEPGPHLRNLENQLRPALRQISAQCRAASKSRNRDRKTQSLIGRVEDTHDLATSGYLTAEDAEVLVRRALEQITIVREEALASQLGSESAARLDEVESKLNDFSGDLNYKSFRHIPPTDVAAYQKVFLRIALASPSPRVAKELIEAVMRPDSFADNNGSSEG